MVRQYRYIKLDQKRHFCLQQNPFMLFWVLFFKKDTLRSANINGLKKWSIRWIKSKIREYYNFFKTISKFISILKFKYHLQNIDSFVELPFYGQICVLVNKGYKIFDLRRRIAIKVYRDDVDIPTITKELECLKNGSLFDFAPSIRKIKIEDRWYEEDYVSGSLDYSVIQRNSSDLLEKFFRDVYPCLERLLLYHPPTKEYTINYMNEIKSRLSSCNLQKEGLDTEQIDRIHDFIHSIDERLHYEGNIPFFLVLTHGDFCPANMLNTRRGLRVIDWESASLRSALFDFYSYFFYRSVHRFYPIPVPVNKVCSEIKAALPFIISKLEPTAFEIAESVKLYEKVYRWLYYIERVYMLIERKKYDTKLNIIEFILRYIEICNSYEKIYAENTEKTTC